MTKYVTVAFVTSDIQVHQKKWDAPQKCQNQSKSSGGKTAGPRLKRVVLGLQIAELGSKGPMMDSWALKISCGKDGRYFKGLFWDHLCYQ